MKHSLHIPTGFTPYEPKGHNMISGSRTPLVGVGKNHIALNPALLQRVEGARFVMLFWGEEAKEVGLWFFKTRVPRSEHLCGHRHQLCRYVSWRGFRNKFLLDGAHVGEVFTAKQSDENADFFTFSLRERR